MAGLEPVCDNCGHTQDLHMVGVGGAELCVGVTDEWNDPEPCKCDKWVPWEGEAS